MLDHTGKSPLPRFAGACQRSVVWSGNRPVADDRPHGSETGHRAIRDVARDDQDEPGEHGPAQRRVRAQTSRQRQPCQGPGYASDSHGGDQARIVTCDWQWTRGNETGGVKNRPASGTQTPWHEQQGTPSFNSCSY